MSFQQIPVHLLFQAVFPFLDVQDLWRFRLVNREAKKEAYNLLQEENRDVNPLFAACKNCVDTTREEVMTRDRIIHKLMHKFENKIDTRLKYLVFARDTNRWLSESFEPSTLVDFMNYFEFAAEYGHAEELETIAAIWSSRRGCCSHAIATCNPEALQKAVDNDHADAVEVILCLVQNDMPRFGGSDIMPGLVKSRIQYLKSNSPPNTQYKVERRLHKCAKENKKTRRYLEAHKETLHFLQHWHIDNLVNLDGDDISVAIKDCYTEVIEDILENLTDDLQEKLENAIFEQIHENPHTKEKNSLIRHCITKMREKGCILGTMYHFYGPYSLLDINVIGKMQRPNIEGIQILIDTLGPPDDNLLLRSLKTPYPELADVLFPYTSRDSRLRFLSLSLQQGKNIVSDDVILTNRGEDMTRVALKHLSSHDVCNCSELAQRNKKQ